MGGKRFLRMGVAGLAIVLAPGVDASFVWGSDASGYLTDSRSSAVGEGVTATQQWADGGFVIDWEISFSFARGQWTYKYTIEVTDKELSHFILEVTNDAQPFSILGGTSTPIEGPTTYSGADPSNPQMPNPVYGVKFNFGSGRVTYTIVTDRAPVWGVFYTKDGKTDGEDVVAWSNALNYGDYQRNASLTVNDFIVRPDGNRVVPLPAAVWLLGAGFLGYLGIGYSRRKDDA